MINGMQGAGPVQPAQGFTLPATPGQPANAELAIATEAPAQPEARMGADADASRKKASGSSNLQLPSHTGVAGSGLPQAGNLPTGGSAPQGPAGLSLPPSSRSSLELEEHVALDGMMQSFLQDGQLSQKEMGLYQQVRGLFTSSPAAAPMPAPAPVATAPAEAPPEPAPEVELPAQPPAAQKPVRKPPVKRDAAPAPTTPRPPVADRPQETPDPANDAVPAPEPGAKAPSKAAPVTSAPSTLPGTRDKWLQPFASDSIWNMPIGSGAVYKPANLGPAKNVRPDHDLLYRLKAGDPERPVFAPGSFGPGRDTGTKYQGIKLPIPDSLIVPDATKNSTPNNCAAFLMPDGKTIVQVNPLARTKPGGNIYGWVVPGQSIYGDGIKGGHGGSGLSSIGGTVRKGELLSDEPIRHALKVNIWAKKYAYYNKADVKGYRWPADRADSYAAREYGGKDPSLVMGSLLAIPPGATAESLGLTTDAGRKLFAAFQDYGAYVVDDSAWDAHYIAMEKGAPDELKEKTGLELNKGPLKDDINKLFQALAIVDNNSPKRVGGGGTPRQPLAPPIGN